MSGSSGAADKLHGETLPYQAGYTVLTVREPHGVTGHIIPWNYPMQIFGRSAGAALAAGNACVVKPAEDASLSILRVAEIAASVGFPAGALNVITGYGAEAGAALCAHPGVDHISFTGSTTTGKAVAHAAAERHCPITLELGGKSPQIVFADADVDEALPIIINAIIQNSGQTCSAGSRLLVERPLYESLLRKLVQRFELLRSGPPDMDLDMGPLINQKQVLQVKQFVEDAERAGIQVAARGLVVHEASGKGFYQEAVLFRDVSPVSRLAQEEVFGPVLAVTPFDSEAEAIQIANGMLAAARVELDETKRKQIYHDLQLQLVNEGGEIIPVFADNLSGASDKVAGFTNVPGGGDLSGYRVAEKVWLEA